MKLTARECAILYPAVNANAIRHLMAADILAKNGDYGNAIAHRILGSEEMLKGFILFMEGKGMDLRSINAIKPLFRHHVPRHKLFKTLFSALHVLESIRNSSRLSNSKALLTLFKGGLESYYNSKWWENAELYKQNAFYADYQNSFNDPLKLTKENYEVTSAQTQTVNIRITDIIAYISKLTEDELSWFKECFHLADFKELLEETIKK